MGALFSAAWRNSIVCVLLLIAADSFAAEPDVAPGWSALHWSVEDGLPVNSINQIAQDENGYIWLATMDGLARFDGQNFKVYDSGSHPGLASNRLTRIEHADDACGCCRRTTGWCVTPAARSSNSALTTAFPTRK